MVVNVSLGDFGSLSLGVRVLCWMNLMLDEFDDVWGFYILGCRLLLRSCVGCTAWSQAIDR
jgi:hypothetical protein